MSAQEAQHESQQRSARWQIAVLFAALAFVLILLLSGTLSTRPIITLENAYQVSEMTRISQPSVDSIALETDLTFSPDSTHLGFFMYGGVYLWQLNGRVGQTMSGADWYGPYPAGIVSTNVSGPILVFGDNMSDDTVLQDMKTGNILRRFADPFLSPITTALSSDSQLFATDYMSDTRIWDMQSGEYVALIPHEPGTSSAIYQAGGRDLLFSTDGAFLAFVTHDSLCECGVAWIWDIASRSMYAVLRGNSGSIASLALSKDTNMVAAGGNDLSSNGTVWLWDLNTLEEMAVFSGSEGLISNLSFSPNNHFLAASSIFGSVQLWDIGTSLQKTVVDVASHLEDRFSPSIDFSVDSSLLAVGTQEGDILLVSTSSGSVVTTLSGHQDQIIEVRFTPDGTLLASSSMDGTVRLWHVSATAPNSKERTPNIFVPTSLPTPTWWPSPSPSSIMWPTDIPTFTPVP